MLQKGDYKKAWQYFTKAIENMQVHMGCDMVTSDHKYASEHTSKSDFMQAQDLAQNRFILAIRYY